MPSLRALNEIIALWVTRKVSTMACAYVFGIIALVALPQAVHDTFSAGFTPMPLVTWTSQAFLQLVLLSVIMVGQAKLSEAAERRADEDHEALLEVLADMREDHAARHAELVAAVKEVA